MVTVVTTRTMATATTGTRNGLRCVGPTCRVFDEFFTDVPEVRNQVDAVAPVPGMVTGTGASSARA
jgi:hypothetical protein